MGKCIVKMTEELFHEFVTQGNAFPSRPGMQLTVKKGLPPGSKLENISYLSEFHKGIILLRFEGPNIPETPFGHELPVYEIVIGETNMEDTAELVPLTVEA